MKKITALLISLLFLVACSAGKDIKTNEVQKIRKGVTTEQQVISMFGEPTSSSLDFKTKKKTLTYVYDNSDQAGHELAGYGGAVVGSVLGPLGAIGGAVLGKSAVKGRAESKQLTVVINTLTSKVVDFNYSHTQGRTRGIGKGGNIGSVGG